jgi:hypothetical protein
VEFGPIRPCSSRSVRCASGILTGRKKSTLLFLQERPPCPPPASNDPDAHHSPLALPTGSRHHWLPSTRCRTPPGTCHTSAPGLRLRGMLVIVGGLLAIAGSEMQWTPMSHRAPGICGWSCSPVVKAAVRRTLRVGNASLACGDRSNRSKGRAEYANISSRRCPSGSLIARSSLVAKRGQPISPTCRRLGQWHRRCRVPHCAHHPRQPTSGYLRRQRQCSHRSWGLHCLRSYTSSRWLS